MKNLGNWALLRLLIRSVVAHATAQAAVAEELKILNGHISRIWPPPANGNLPVTEAEDPLLGDDPYTLSMAEDASVALHHELGRAPSPEEIVARMRVCNERRDPVQGRPAHHG